MCVNSVTRDEELLRKLVTLQQSCASWDMLRAGLLPDKGFQLHLPTFLTLKSAE